MNPEALIESIRVAIAEGASDEARAAGANACRMLLAVLDVKPGEPMVAAVPVPQPPSPPIAAIVSAIRGVPREQLVDLLIAKLRTVVPAETAAPASVRLNIPRVTVPTP